MLSIAMLAIKWLLALLGTYIVLQLGLEEFQQGRFGLGTGMAAALCALVIKGILMAALGTRPPPPPADP